MKKSFAQYAKITLLSLYLFQCNALFTSEKFLARHNKLADNFIQKIPYMTLPEAGDRLHKLESLTKRIIWHKASENAYQNNNDILPTALLLTTLPLEMQYLIFSEDFQAIKQKKLDPETNRKTNVICVPAKARERLLKTSIYELFRWKAIIDQKCGENNSVKIISKIILTKSELFSLTADHLNAINKAHSEKLKHKELCLLAELPDELLEELKRHQMTFSYYEPTFAAMARRTMNILPLILLPLLCTHFYVNPTWNSITETQDPFALERNSQLEISNKTTEMLQYNNVAGSEFLIKHAITPVPFEYSWPETLRSFKPIAAMACVYGALLAYLANAIDSDYDKGSHKSSFIWRTISTLNKYKHKPLYYIVIPTLVAFIPGFVLSLIVTPCAYTIPIDFFSDELSGILSFSTAFSILGAIATMVCDARFEPYFVRYIDFSKKKFENKSVKECINYYLNHPRIVIPN